jgi:hypothetical protein
MAEEVTLSVYRGDHESGEMVRLHRAVAARHGGPRCRAQRAGFACFRFSLPLELQSGQMWFLQRRSQRQAEVAVHGPHGQLFQNRADRSSTDEDLSHHEGFDL